MCETPISNMKAFSILPKNHLQSRIEVELLVEVAHIIIEALFGSCLAREILLQVKSHQVEHVPQVGVVCVLHEDFAETLYEPCAFCAVPVGYIARESGVCYENVFPTELLSTDGEYDQD